MQLSQFLGLLVHRHTGVVQFLESHCEGVQDAHHVGRQLVALLKTFSQVLQLSLRLQDRRLVRIVGGVAVLAVLTDLRLSSSCRFLKETSSMAALLVSPDC